MINLEMSTSLGNVMVATTDNRGWNAEEIAQRAANKIVYIGDQSHPAVQAQARAFKERITHVIAWALREAVEQERSTISHRLREAGHPDLVHLLGD
jgi:hypothetical protein